MAERGRRLIKLVGMSVRLGDPAAGSGRDPGAYADAALERPYSLATACLKAHCGEIPAIRARYDIELVDLVDASEEGRLSERFHLSPADVRALAERAPAAVGFSAYCWNADAVLEACRGLKALLPKTKTVIGGRALEGGPAGVLASNPAVDFVVSGEGEEPLARLALSGFSPEGPVPGVCARLAGRIVATPPAAPLRDLGSLPSPYAEGGLRPPAEGMLLELSRGCLFDCGYCDWNAAKTRRQFPAARIAADLDRALALGVRHVVVVDSAINYETEALARFAGAVSRADPRRRLAFSYNLRHEFLDAGQAALLRAIPPRQVLLGLETVSAAALKACGRAPLDRARFERALDLLEDVAPPLIGVVLGLPGDSAEGFIATMEYLGRLGASRRIGAVLVSLLQVYPGTGLHEKRGALGLRLQSPGVPYLLESPSFSREDLQECAKYLQRFRFRRGVPVKGPEGLAVLTRGRPELLHEGLYGLLEPWEPGSEREGWLFEGAAPIQDGDGFGVYSFRSADGAAEARVRLERKDGRRPCGLRSSFFNISAEAEGGDVARLLRAVGGLARDNEGWVVGI